MTGVYSFLSPATIALPLITAREAGNALPPFDFDRYRALQHSPGIGARVHYSERTTSTMDDARAGADTAGRQSCGDAYVAGEQTAGRGRLGRTWVSAAASGLYVTYHLCPRERQRAPLLSVAGALAAAEAIDATSGLRTELKWPNDVLHGGRKLCGVLAESRLAEAEGTERFDVFLGIGINMRASEQLPPEVAAIATSIEAAGATVPDVERLLAALSDALDRWSALCEHDPAALIASWRERLVTIGRRVRLQTPRETVEGEAVGVTGHGELLLRLDGGAEHAYAAGDVTTL